MTWISIKVVNCIICLQEFVIKSPTHRLCSYECFRVYRNKKRMIEYKQNPPTDEQRRKWYMKSKYGLEEGEWDTIFKSQNYCCAICKTNKPGNINGWCTDHCHQTNKVRGILCHKCNTDIGGYERVLHNIEALNYVS